MTLAAWLEGHLIIKMFCSKRPHCNLNWPPCCEPSVILDIASCCHKQRSRKHNLTMKTFCSKRPHCNLNWPPCCEPSVILDIASCCHKQRSRKQRDNQSTEHRSVCWQMKRKGPCWQAKALPMLVLAVSRHISATLHHHIILTVQ